MPFQDLRSWLEHQRSTGRLVRHHIADNLHYEVATVLSRENGNRAIEFTYRDQVLVGNTFGSRTELAESLGLHGAQALHERYRMAIAHPQKPEAVDPQGAPVLSVRQPEVDLNRLPIPKHHEKDSGPYITAAIAIARDPETGVHNWSIHRLQVSGPNRLGALILPRHLSVMVRKAETHGQDLPIALVIGLAPGLLLASQAITPYGVDEADIAGGLLGVPVRLVQSPKYGIMVPADAEFLLEGRVLAQVREPEGPFGEFPRTYGPRSAKPVVAVDALYHQSSPIYQTILPAGREHVLLGAIPREVAIANAISQVSSNIQDVVLTFAGGCRYHAVISMQPHYPGESKNVVMAAFAGVNEVKRVVVVDPDINIEEPEDVEWALATRVQPDRDLVVVSGALGSALDPSASSNGVTSKWGIDATIPLSDDRERYERIALPSRPANRH